MVDLCMRAGCKDLAMNNDSGLCEPHFEARRAELKAKLEADGPVPVLKAPGSGKRSATAQAEAAKPTYSMWKVAVAAGLVLAFWFFYVIPTSDSSGGRTAPAGFAGAAADELWRIDDSGVALLRRPEQPDSRTAFMANLITVIDPGTEVMVIEGRPSQAFKRVALVSGPDATGWIQAQTVESAKRLAQ